MRGKAWVSRLLPFGAALVAPLLMGFTFPTQSFYQDVFFFARVLDAQNAERTALGVEPMKWNAELAADAQAWADYLASTGKFHHAARFLRAGAGENLWTGTRGAYTADEMVDAWAREKADFEPGPFPADHEKIRAVGHYTQIVWRDSREVGCAVATGRQMDYLVCRYSNAGNVIGEMPF